MYGPDGKTFLWDGLTLTPFILIAESEIPKEVKA